MKHGISILNISDIHLGHNKTAAIEIFNNLKLFMYDYRAITTKVDMIVIPGDLHDKLLSFSSKDALVTIELTHFLLNFCKKHDIILRLMDGTTSHDMGQGSIIEKIIDESDIDIDFKYFDTLDIEYIPKLDIHCMYIPDELVPTGEELILLVKEKLIEYKLKQVDMLFMHGMFKFQIPIKSLPFLNDEKDYIPLVRYFIIIGHDHMHKSYKDKIIVPSSFDRLKHNEEEPKGGVVCYIHPSLPMRWQFLENKNAKTYKTIRLKKNIQDVKKFIKRALSNIREGSYLRVITTERLESDIEKDIKKLYPEFHIKFEKESEEDEKIERKEVAELAHFEITDKNILELMRERLDVDDSEWEIIIDELKKIL